MNSLLSVFSVVGKDRAGVGMIQEKTKLRRLKSMLGRKLAEFLDSDTKYSMRRLLTAELQYLYVGPHAGEEWILYLFTNNRILK